jgi:tRNA-2-methylthio-N6-dimethylallyladenosine synthase
MNKAESQRIASYLSCAGYQAASSFWKADLIVLNTCVVRQSAEDRVLGTLGLLKGIKERRPNLFILVTGCFVDSNVADLQRRFPHVDFFFKPGAYSELTSWAQKQGISAVKQGVSSYVPVPSPSVFVPIIQGCNNFCSYCIVPYRRGREISRSLKEVIFEVKELAKQGTREVILLGQNVDSYGHDLPEHPDLADLLAELNCVDKLSRIRFLTNHPKDMSQKLIEAIASLDKVCEHLNLAVQSGDDDILTAMRRGYSVEQYRELVRTIKESIPQISLSTDVIVGFPGETEEHFEHTLALLREMRFDVVHVAAYSPRHGTIACRKYEDNVPSEVKRERLNRIERLQENIAAEINSTYQGKTVEVLVEGKKKGKWYGRTRTDKLVFYKDDIDQVGQLVKVWVDKASPWALQGKAK